MPMKLYTTSSRWNYFSFQKIIQLIYPDEKQRNDILGALDIYTFGLTKG